MSSEDQFNLLVAESEASTRSHHHIGGNAALMADRIAANFPSTEVYLVGPIGPRSQALLHPSVKRTNSTRILKVCERVGAKMNIIVWFSGRAARNS